MMEAGWMQGSRDPAVCAAPGTSPGILFALLQLSLRAMHWAARQRCEVAVGRGGSGLSQRVGEVSSVWVAGVPSVTHLEEGIFHK